jgi:hypothetical protein
MGNNLTSTGALAYQGTNAASPSNVTVHYNRPTANYYQGFQIGDFWVYRVSQTSNENELWVLMGVAGNVANWVLLSTSMGAVLGLTGNTGGFVGPTAGNINVVGDGTTITVAGNPGTSTLTISATNAGDVTGLKTDDTHVVTPTAGVIQIHGGTGIATTGTVGPNTVTISTSGVIPDSFPTDSGTATPSGGVLNIKAGVSTQNSGSSVEFTGSSNTVLLNVTDSNGNTIVGKSSGNSSITSVNNTILGASSGSSITSGTGLNVIVGEAAGASITTGSKNILLGASSGSSYTSTESSNIVVNNTGTVSESNTLRIGSGTGTSAGQLNASYISGIYGKSFGGTNGVVFVDNTNKLGSSSFSALTWTPVLQFGGASTGITYGVQEGIYQNIGNLVFYSAAIVLTSKGSASGTATITGLPFNSSGVYATQFGALTPSFSLTGTYTYTWAINTTGTNTLTLYAGGPTVSSAAVTDAGFTNGTNLAITGFYFTT